MPEATGRLAGKQVVLAPVATEHVADLRRILHTPEVAHRWGPEADGWPFEEDSEDVVRYAVLVDGAVRGLVQYGEEADPMYRHASIDIFLDPAVHGRGIGTDTMRTIARHLVHDLRHHRLVIDWGCTATPQRSGATRQSASARSASCGATSGTPTAKAGTTAC